MTRRMFAVSRWGLAFLTAILLPCSLARAKTIYVNASSPAVVPNGATWSTAYVTVQNGIDGAVAGDDIWVAAGTYRENITLKDGTAVYGGFSGTETVRDQRDWGQRPTILDGMRVKSVVTAAQNVSARLDGFTLQNGIGQGASPSDYRRNGGGVNIDRANVTITNCTITANSAAYYGGGVYCSGGASTIVHNTISSNTAGSGGGAISCAANTTVTISDNLISGNTLGATASGYGAAIFSTASSPQILGNRIVWNTVQGSTSSGGVGGYGGGFACTTSGAPLVSGNYLAGNSAGSGGAFYIGCAATLRGNIITGNAANSGGGAYLTGANSVFANNTVADNGSVTDGGGLHIESGSPTIVNNIVAFNALGILVTTRATPAFRNNDIVGNAGGDYSGSTDPVGKNGNLRVDPLFVGSTSGDLHIQPASTLINAGDNSVTVSGQTDMDGQPRVQGGTVDIGADESDGTAWPSAPRIVHVRTNGDDHSDGETWGTALKTVTAATRLLLGRGGEVWVAAGVYYGTVKLGPATALYGGFAGDESQRESRNPGRNATILDGQVQGSVVTVNGTAICTIDGFTIRGGSGIVGGGIRSFGASPRITNNTIAGNDAQTGGGIATLGGAPLVTRNRILGNTAGATAGVYVTGAARVAGNEIAANTCGYYNGYSTNGTAVYLSGPVVFSNNTVVNNTDTGSSWAFYATKPTVNTLIANNIFAFNSHGIGIDTQGASTAFGFRKNVFFGNGSDTYFGLSTANYNELLNVDPHLAAPSLGNLHIQPYSPCRDAGFNGAALASDLDIDGEPRIQGAAIDIGADESNLRLVLPTPRIIRVTTGGNDADDGTAWPRAKRTVQAAIDALQSGGGEIWVAQGTYPSPVVLAPYTALFGGFAGTETTRVERDWSLHPTILDAGARGPVVSAPIQAVGSTVDGFTLQNGQAATGAGVAWYGASGIIRHNIISENTARGVSPVVGQGGGIFANRCEILIDDNVITRNAADQGGGVTTLAASATLRNNTISDNQAGKAGGIYLAGGLSALTNNIVAFNTGGIDASSSSPSLILTGNCVFGNGIDFGSLTPPEGYGGNIQKDPLFVDRAVADYRIRPASPCIDAGLGTGIPTDARDIANQPRIQFERVDIGAYESPVPRSTTGLPRVYVRSTGNDSNDGSTWARSKKTISAGLDAALAGGEVWVAAGVYTDHIILPDRVSLLGGFTGNGDERKPTSAITAIEPLGGLAAVLAPFTVAPSCVFDGFTLRNGPLLMVCDGGSPTVTNNRFVVMDGGVGVSCRASSAPRIDHNAFGPVDPASDVTYRGGAVNCTAAAATISANVITGLGKAIECTDTTLTLEGNTIVANYRAGVTLTRGSATIRHNVISRNAGGITAEWADLLLDGNSIRLNQGTVGTSALYINGGNVTVRNNVVAGNGGVDSWVPSDVGAAMDIGSLNATVTNNTIVGHNAISGGAVLLSGTVLFANNILAFNGAGLERQEGSIGALTLRNNCTFGNRDFDYLNVPNPVGKDGNIQADPNFASLLSGNMHIEPLSPCLNAGDDSVVSSGDGDVDGSPRIQQGCVDIGAYESDGSVVPSASNVIHVQVSGNDSNDGLTWATAKRTIQAGVDAVAALDGGEVWVAGGTYSGLVDIRGFTQLYGGFGGTESSRSQRDIGRYPTTIDGSTVTLPWGGGGMIHVLPGSMFTEIDGFTIRGVSGTSLNTCGIQCGDGSSIAIRHNVIRDNGAAGVQAEESFLEISDNTFTGNTGGAIGGRYCPNLTVIGNRIIANSNGGSGTAVDMEEGNVVIANNVIAGNRALAAGILRLNTSGSVVVANNTIVGNVYNGSSQDGATLAGAVAVFGAAQRVVNNIIAWNTTGIETGSGASLATLRGNLVYGNTTYDYHGTADPTGTNGNLHVDPKLVDLSLGRLHIQPGSPCINAGDMTYVDPTWTDMDGQPRVLGGQVDIGADESDGTLWNASPVVIRVSTSGNDALDGLSWETAKRSVQAALDTISLTGGEVWVKAGTYGELLAIGPYASIYGGFAGVETAREQRNPAASHTELDGGRRGVVVTVRSGCQPTSIDGFTIRNGYAVSPDYYKQVPSGVNATASSLVLSNNTFTQNTGTGSVAVMCSYSDVVISRNALVSNVGGITCQTTTGRITDNTLADGYLKCTGGPNTVAGNVLTDGAIQVIGTGTVSRNRLTGVKGGVSILLGDSSDYSPTPVTVTDNLLANRGAGSGGIVCTVRVSGLIANNTLIGRKSQNMYNAGINLDDSSTLAVNNIVVGYDTGVNGDPILSSNNDIYDVITPGTTRFNPVDLIGKKGNISSNPLFVNTAAADYHLTSASPCVNAGLNSAVTSGDTDLGGLPRISAGTVDIGAYEYQSASGASLITAEQALRMAGGVERATTQAGASGSGAYQAPAPALDIVRAAQLARHAAGLSQAQ